MDNQVITKWSEFKLIVNELDLDLLKNAKGNNAAGVRLRKGLRMLRLQASNLIKTTTEIDKARKAAKRHR